MNAELKTDDWIYPPRLGTGHGVSVLANDHWRFGNAEFLGLFFERQPTSHLRRCFFPDRLFHGPREPICKSEDLGNLENWKWLQSSWL